MRGISFGEGRLLSVSIYSDAKGHTLIRLPILASDDDIELARELAIKHAEFFNVSIGLDDWPDEVFPFLGTEAAIPGVPPSLELIRKHTANIQKFDNPSGHGFFVWKDKGSRGVHLFRDRNQQTAIRIMNFESNLDRTLALELLAAHAPSELEDGLALSTEAGKNEGKGVFVPIEFVREWPDNWHSSWRKAEMAAILMRLTEGGLGKTTALLNGPKRSVFVGQSLLTIARLVAGESEPSEKLSAALIELIVNIQDGPELPYLERAVLNPNAMKPVNFFQKMLGKNSLKRADDDPWAPPSPSNPHKSGASIAETIFFRKDQVLTQEATIVLIVEPLASYFVPYADYIAIRTDSGEWAAVSFGVFFAKTRELNVAFLWDDSAIMVEMLDAGIWEKLREELLKSAQFFVKT